MGVKIELDGKSGMYASLSIPMSMMGTWGPERIRLFFDGIAQALRASTDIQSEYPLGDWGWMLR